MLRLPTILFLNWRLVVRENLLYDDLGICWQYLSQCHEYWIRDSCRRIIGSKECRSFLLRLRSVEVHGTKSVMLVVVAVIMWSFWVSKKGDLCFLVTCNVIYRTIKYLPCKDIARQDFSAFLRSLWFAFRICHQANILITVLSLIYAPGRLSN